MPIVITTEEHFLTDGKHVYTQMLGDYSYWQRYLAFFEAVIVLARVKSIVQPPDNAKRADGDAVFFIELPDFIGPLQVIRVLPLLMIRIWRAAKIQGAFLLRIPGIMGAMLFVALRIQRRMYGARVLGDPAESLNPLILQKRSATLFRPVFTRILRAQCRAAHCISYVTKGALQLKYPSRASFQNHYSDVNLPDELFAAAPHAVRSSTVYRLVFVGSLAQRYKGLHILLDAVHRCVQAGLDVYVDVLGGGIHSSEYVEMADTLGLGARVTFHGNVSRDMVFKVLRSADMFVMPSLTEGMPRAMLEAMACGLPCLGSAVGGIPEILSPEDTFPAGDAAVLAERLRTILPDPGRMERMSRRNFERAHDYRASLLNEQREQFYRALRHATALQELHADHKGENT